MKKSKWVVAPLPPPKLDQPNPLDPTGFLARHAQRTEIGWPFTDANTPQERLFRAVMDPTVRYDNPHLPDPNAPPWLRYLRTHNRTSE